MKSEKKKVQHKVLFVCFPIIYLMLIVVQVYLDILRMNSFNGVVQAIGFTLCLVLVMLDYKKGRIIAYVLLMVSVANVLRAIIVSNNIAPVPGLVNLFISIATVGLLSYQFKNKQELIVTDMVTGLQNRRGLYQYLEGRTKSQQELDICVLYIDNFKLLNDNHGREYGDRLLSYVANIVSDKLGDKGKVFRLGGPEFVMAIDCTSETKQVVEKIVELLGDKFYYEKEGASFSNYLSVYAGISRYPNDSMDIESMINYADMAMLHAANSHSKRVFYFDKSMEKQVQDDIDIEKLIEEGLQNDYFYMMYQPQFEIVDKKLRGFESLIRMKKPDGTMVSPGQFIPVAEKSDLIMKIDDYVLHRVLMEFKDEVIKANNSFTISVNISAKNIANIGYAEKVIEVIKSTGFPAECLEIEITEYCLAKSVDIAVENIEKLRSIGVQVALDDFGTGYTSLHYLAKLPINLLKIDKSMIDDIVSNKKSEEFVNAIISLGHMMNCEVISEGVEEESQIELLRKQNCDFVQGFIWSKPLSLEDAIKEI